MENTQSGPGGSIIPISIRNTKGYAYLSDTQRFSIDPETGNLTIQDLIDDIWQPGSFETGPNSLWIGRNVGVAAAGHHLLTEDPHGLFHYHTHSDFDGELSLSDAQTLYSYSFLTRYESQADYSNEWIGKEFTWSAISTINGLMKKGYWKTGSIAATKPIRIQTWHGADENGALEFDQRYPASHFIANSEIETLEDGFVELVKGENYFTKISSETDFSLLTNAVETMPWNAIDISLTRYDNLLQEAPWVDGETYFKDESWVIRNRKIYECNTTGVQNGTFEDNATLWDVLGSDHIAYNEVADFASLPDPAEHALEIYIVLNSTGAFWNKRKGLYHSDGAIWSRMSNVSYQVTDAEAFFRDDVDNSKIGKFELSEISADTTRTFTFPDVSGRIFIDGMTANISLNGIMTAIGGNSTNWNEAYGWGDHAQVGYLTEETDPIFSNWEAAFTEGSIVFADVNGLIENNSELFWDNTNKRLGLGLTDPARMIHMQGRNATFRIDRDTNSPAVQMHHFPTGDFTTPLKGFIFGVSAAGADDGIFFISDFHQNVSGGGDNRLTIDTDGKIVIPGALDIGGIITGDGSGLTNLVETDPIFSAWDRSEGIEITESQISDLSHIPAFDGDITEIYNSAGLFKIQPDVQGDVELFGDTNVANNENSKIFKIWRRASEGNDYIRFYVSANRTAYIHASNVLTLQAQNPFIINSITDDITFRVGDNAGAKKTYFKDSENVTVASIDSNGKLWIDANMGGGLEINRGSQNNIKTYMDWQYTDIRFSGDKDYNRIGTWIDKSFQIVTDSLDRIIIDKYGRVTITNNLTIASDLTVNDDIMVYGDIFARNHLIDRAAVFHDNSTQTEAGERHFSHGHTHTAIYNNDWYDSDSENISERDLHFSPDGLMMYIIGLANGGVGDCCIWEYSLTVPWDLSTVGTPTIKSIEAYGSNQVGLFIDVDGRRLWTVCTNTDTVIEYSMNPWNISSLSWVQAKDISGQDSSPSAVFWSANGDRLFIAGDGDNDIVAFSIVNEWDISGISWFQDFGTDIDAPTGLHFSSDGRRMYVMDGSAEDDIHEFHLSSPWMIDSARLVNLFDVSAENASPQGIFLTSDNAKIFMVGTNTPDGVYSYDLGTEAKGLIIAGTFKAENMPTSDPTIAGKFWNDGTYVRVSAG